MGLNNPGGYKGAVKPVSKCEIQNGSFETGSLSPWIDEGENSPFVLLDGIDGSYCCDLYAHTNSDTYSCGVSQSINCSPVGDTLQFYYKTYGNGLTNCTLYISSPDGYKTYALNNDLPHWTLYQLVWPAELVQTPVEIFYNVSGGMPHGTNLTMRIDAVKFIA